MSFILLSTCIFFYISSITPLLAENELSRDIFSPENTDMSITFRWNPNSSTIFDRGVQIYMAFQTIATPMPATNITICRWNKPRMHVDMFHDFITVLLSLLSIKICPWMIPDCSGSMSMWICPTTIPLTVVIGDVDRKWVLITNWPRAASMGPPRAEKRHATTLWMLAVNARLERNGTQAQSCTWLWTRPSAEGRRTLL